MWDNARSLGVGVSPGNDEVVSLVDFQMGVAGDVAVSEALKWVIVLRGGKGASVPGLNFKPSGLSSFSCTWIRSRSWRA